MTRFLEGPAAGMTLSLRRAPLFLRVVRNDAGQFDALDQFTDAPTSNETLFVSRRKGEAGTCHIDYTDAKTRRRSGKWFTVAEYELFAVQPADDVLRSTEAWRTWCLEQVKATTEGNGDGQKADT